MGSYSVSLKCGSFLIAFLLLVGCANIGKVKFDKAANTNIKKIALLRVDEPRRFILNAPRTRLDTTAGAAQTAGAGALGCLGIGVLPITMYSLVTSAARSTISNPDDNDFQKALNDHQIHFGPAMVESLRQELTKKGYDFIYLKDQSLMVGGDEKGNYLSHIQSDADAILFVSIGVVGYSATGNKKGEYKPTVSVHARLIDSRSKKIIYSGIFRVGELSGGVNVENMLPVEGYKYNSLDTLLKDINEAAQGIIDCHRKIAARIAEQLT